jgi:hypothetical protein
VILDDVPATGGGADVEALGVVAEPLSFELSLVLSPKVVDVVELALVLLVAAAAAPPPSSPPQPASAIAKLPIKDAITTRCVVPPRLACIFPTPDK